MAGLDENTIEPTSAPRAEKPKKPYIDPAFRFEKVFETMALACGKIAPTEFQCRFTNRRNS